MSVRTRIKVCGVTRLKDAEAAAELGADFLGFNFYPKSPRYVSPSLARAMQADLPAAVVPVGVFVNEDAGKIRRTIEDASLAIVQLHGDENMEFCESLGAPCIRSFRAGSKADLAGIEEWRSWAVLIDSKTPEYGGSGVKADWSLAAAAMDRMFQKFCGHEGYGLGKSESTWQDVVEMSGSMPLPDPGAAAESLGRCGRLFLAGGLTPENVAEAIETVRPWAVDVASGVEKAPGQKDRDAIRRFIEAVNDVT